MDYGKYKYENKKKQAANWIRITVTEMQSPVSQIEIVRDRWIRITVTENRIKLWSVTFHGGDVMDASLKSTFFIILQRNTGVLVGRKTRISI
jgi:hypothetical protein